MSRLDKERQNELEPKRIEFALSEFSKVGIKEIISDPRNKSLCFYFKGHLVKFFPYSGWHTGKSIKDGRGLQNLLKQLK